LEHVLTETEKSVWLKFKAVCLNFLRNVKAKSYKELVEDLLNTYETLRWDMLLMAEEWLTWGTVPPGSFHHGKKICRDVFTEHFSWLLLEPYLMGSVVRYKRMIYRKVFSWVKPNMYFHILLCTCMKLFLYRILTATFVFLMFISTWRIDLKPSDSYTVVDSIKIQVY
jgi:hypothetical protein